MKYFLFFNLLNSVLALFTQMKSSIETRNALDLAAAAHEINTKVLANEATTRNLIFCEHSNSFALKDFKDGFLPNTTQGVRIESSNKVAAISGRRRHFTIILTSNLHDFNEIYCIITRSRFRLDGYFTIVLIGEAFNVENIFKELWKKQIYNVNILVKESDKVLVKTFMPFSAGNCIDTSPTLINEFKNGKFINGLKNFFPDKLKNLFNCTVRVSISSSSEPFVFATRLANGSRWRH